MTTTTQFRLLCRPQSAAGFELIGLPVLVADDGAAVLRHIERMRDEGEVGLVLIEESLESALPEEIQLQTERGQRPVLLPFPGPCWRGESTAQERIVALLRRAIGYRVKL